MGCKPPSALSSAWWTALSDGVVVSKETSIQWKPVEVIVCHSGDESSKYILVSHFIWLIDCMWQYRWKTASWGHFSLRVSWVLCHLWANRVGVWFLVRFSFSFFFWIVFFPSTLPRRYQKDVLGHEVTPFLVGVSTAAKLSSVKMSKEHTAQYCVYYLLLLLWNVSVSWVFLPTVLFPFAVRLFLWFIYLLFLVWSFCLFLS